ncbi:hypothetical protein [Nitrobacter sp.]|uniref:hypothetical protein n=1 Tax=Nitrobacter sp. TaxID=29420 RepID=UPI0029CAC6E9|nr:hypothetical protein [Nitrobacter sp.]
MLITCRSSTRAFATRADWASVARPSAKTSTIHLLRYAAGSPNWIDIGNLYAFSLLLIAILVACEVGWQVGLRAEGHGGSNVATLEGSLFGLLALIIGFTFVMALARYEGRREAVLTKPMRLAQQRFGRAYCPNQIGWRS